tara:strand:+ start:595 stop:1050 length:456 start_codon:yes stop_codon:yes gene_type:complete
MADQQTSSPSDKKEEKKKGVMNKLQELTPDKEEQIALVGVAVRLGIVVWSGFCLTLAYIDLPGFPKQTFDPTFIASIFTSTLTTFGVQAASKKGGGGMSKEEVEKMVKSSASEQVIRVQTPLTINGAEVVQQPKIDPITGKEVDPITGQFK